jgi:unsaturated rhamnogalacturonyl hydrolase
MKNYPIVLVLVMFLGACAPQKPQPKTVTLDYYFNHEFQKGPDGAMHRFHYTWEDTTYNGFSKLGDIFRANGAVTDTLGAPPTAASLKNTDIYIIVDPDTKAETPDPHYISPDDVKAIDDWVRAGGVLAIFANDSGNTELPHLNTLASTFGIRFNYDFLNPVPGDSFELGCFQIPPDDSIFKTAKKVYLKGISSLSVSGDAKAELTSPDGHVIIATARYGKGTVFAVGDPWLYNEYCNGRLPASYHIDNDKAAKDLAAWLISRVPEKP